ncbi:OsmC family protein [Picrophilus oshimae]|uniref:OsmC-like protein n=1 Tax=Picrophilus torridus (strain ATCC 700027 / DSM 9790 / JCM 10055 / NBRC 100828 / KAW 2/3) TaxID=1122961 RepID=Q6L1Z8_PICTO|nr:OsmC family protein [Picrophilus oshimae]AAT43004.1 OsmC-like protein [Picrophilus oshimae DSM 9789]SMD30694.1 putative redox protein [Picrophilus oshimae DSM 9789]
MKVSFKFDPDTGFISDDEKSPVSIKNSIINNDSHHSPTELLMLAMGSCTSDDVLNILKKMRQNVKNYRCEIEGEKRDEHPRILRYAVIHYIFEGDIDPESARKAIELSLEKYCSVSIMAKRGGVDVSYYYTINNIDYH